MTEVVGGYDWQAGVGDIAVNVGFRMGKEKCAGRIVGGEYRSKLGPGVGDAVDERIVNGDKPSATKVSPPSRDVTAWRVRRHGVKEYAVVLFDEAESGCFMM